MPPIDAMITIPPVALLSHMADDRARREKDARQIHLQHTVSIPRECSPQAGFVGPLTPALATRTETEPSAARLSEKSLVHGTLVGNITDRPVQEAQVALNRRTVQIPAGHAAAERGEDAAKTANPMPLAAPVTTIPSPSRSKLISACL